MRTRTQRPPARTAVLAIVGTLVAVVGVWAVTTIVMSVTGDDDVNPLELAQVMCDPPRDGTRLEDDGGSLIVDGKGTEDTTGVGVEALACILDTLKAPAAVVEKVSTTRALDGRQAAGWAGLEASWTYHPDDGLSLIVTRAG